MADDNIATKENTPAKVGKIVFDKSVCKICGKSFSKPQLLAAHKRLVHPGSPTNRELASSKNKGKAAIYGCSECGKRFRSPQLLGAHKRYSHPVKPVKKIIKSFVCPECGKSYTAPTGLGAHRSKIHGITGTSESAIGFQRRKEREAPADLICPECGKGPFSTAAGLGSHRLIVHKIAGTSHMAVYKRSLNGNSASTAHEQENGISQFALGHTIASIQSLIAHICEREEVPVHVFTARVVELLSPGQIRQKRRMLR